MLLREDYRTEEHNAAKPQPQEGIVSAYRGVGVEVAGFEAHAVVIARS